MGSMDMARFLFGTMGELGLNGQDQDGKHPFWNQLAPFLANALGRDGDKPDLIIIPEQCHGNNIIAENVFVSVQRRISPRKLNQQMSRFYKVREGVIGKTFKNGYFWTPDAQAKKFLVRIVNLTGSRPQLTKAQEKRGRGLEVELIIMAKYD